MLLAIHFVGPVFVLFITIGILGLIASLLL